MHDLPYHRSVRRVIGMIYLISEEGFIHLESLPELIIYYQNMNLYSKKIMDFLPSYLHTTSLHQQQMIKTSFLSLSHKTLLQSKKEKRLKYSIKSFISCTISSVISSSNMNITYCYNFSYKTLWIPTKSIPIFLWWYGTYL